MHTRLCCAAAFCLLVTAIGGRAATVGSADTLVDVEPTRQGLRVLSLTSPASKTNWVRPQLMPLVDSAIVGEKTVPLVWLMVRDAKPDQPPGGQVFVFTCANPKLEIRSLWEGSAGPGPVRHQLSIINRGTEAVLLPLQTTLAFDGIGASAGGTFETWWVEKGAGHPSDVGVHRQAADQGLALNSTPYAMDETHEPIPWTSMYDPQARRGWYLGIESSAQVSIRLTRQEKGENAGAGAVLHVQAGLTPEEGAFTRLLPGETLILPPVFVGCYEGDVDDGCNRLRQWVQARVCPAATDPRYPLLANNTWGCEMNIDDARCRKMIDESAGLGLELFHIDAGWYRGVGDWRPSAVKFPNGLAPVADYAHAKGLKFGLWVGWTQGGADRGGKGPERPLSVFDPQRRNWFAADAAADWKPSDFIGRPVCLGNPAAADWCLGELRRIVKEYKLDLLEHDQVMIVDSCTRADHLHSPARGDVAQRAADGYYGIYDTLRRENPDLLFEDCVNGGRMVDYGVLRRVHYVSITDTYDPLSNRRAFWDASYALPPAMCECYIQNRENKTLPNFVYMLRSGMMGWCTVMADTTWWSPQQHVAAKRQFELYRSVLRPLILHGELYHVSARPDGVGWDGIQYMDSKSGRGVVFVFRGSTNEANHRFTLKGLAAGTRYAVSSEDGGVAAAEYDAEALQKQGLSVHLGQTENSDLIFLQRR